MIAFALLLLVGEPPVDEVVIRTRELQGFTQGEGLEAADALMRALRARGTSASIDDPAWPCEEARCAAEVARRASASHVVFLHLLAAGTQRRMTAERVTPAGGLERRAQLDLPRDERVASAMSSVAELLFPREFVTPSSSSAPPQPVERGLAWGLVGGGAAAVIAGAVLRIAAEAQRADVEEATAAVTRSELESTRSAVRAQLTASTILWVAAAAATGAGVALLFSEH